MYWYFHIYTACTVELKEYCKFIEIKYWNNVELSVQFLINKGVPVDDVKCFDQLSHVKKFSVVNSLVSLSTHQKWTICFENSKNGKCQSELLKILQFFFAVPAHSANTDWVYHWCNHGGQRRITFWLLSHSEAFYSYSTIPKEFFIQISLPSWRMVNNY